MRQPARTARHDPALGLEAYCLQGVERPGPFPATSMTTT